MSSDYISRLTNSDHLVQAIEQSRQVQPIIESYRSSQLDDDRITSFIRAVLSAEKSSAYSSGELISRAKKYLNDDLTQDELNRIVQQTLTISKASLNLDVQSSDSKKSLRTRLAPILDHDDGEIVLVFRREVMHHPDATFSFQSRKAVAQGTAFQQYRSKLHCSIHGYEDVAAAQIFAAMATKRKNIDPNEKSIIDYLINADSDHLFEGHLPDLIPLDYIEDVFISRSTFDSFKRPVQDLVKSTFGQSLHIISLNLSSHGDRLKYGRDVNEQLLTKLKENMSRPRTVSGTVVSLPASDFTRFVLLPFTIEQVTDGTNEVFIYWQSMFGDMMITLSNQPIDDPPVNSTEMKYLVCYVAKTPSTMSREYQEFSSYLNDADPTGHRKIIKDKAFRANSNCFHRGCDLENYLTYCLKLEKNTGHVTLSQAGSNSLYGREKIAYRFDKSKLNLNHLNFIQISAGSQPVFIRNLLVSSNEINGFHPSIDKHFQKTDQISPKKDKPHEMHPSSSRMDSVSASTHAAVHAAGSYLGLNKDLTPCRYSVNCLEQTSEKHCRQFSHPCQFSELCRKKDKEQHLTHEPHQVTNCRRDPACTKLSDPHHRAQYRHSNLPDFLTPCRDQAKCQNFSPEHRIKYSHGEPVLPFAAAAAAIQRPKSPEKRANGSVDRHLQRQNVPYSSSKKLCPNGSECRICDSGHRSMYSH